jgi:methionyl-tRNA formyltransferase
MRGRNLAYHAIMNGQPEFGATLHYMAPEYDTGDIIECRRFPILESHNAGDLVDIAYRTLAELFTEYVPRLLSGEVIPGTSQGGGKYYKKYDIDEPIAVTARQKKLIRALTVADRYYASTIVGGRRYRFVPEGDE